MESNKDENFYKKKQLTNNLDKILSQVTFFLKNCEKHKLEESELNNLIYTHSIYKNRNRISEFLDKINNSEWKIRDKVIELQEESEMRQKKKNEVEDLKNILNVNMNMNNNLLTNESQDKSILLITEGLSEDKTENDILVEDTKDVENRNLLKKKRTKDKGKDKEGETKEKYIYKTCYICKQKLGLDNISKFYGSLCTKCGDYNYSFRTMKLDFTGRIAIVTGGRIKIGFYIVKKLLSYGCKVITNQDFQKMLY